jgi:hypothetical protein
MKTLGHTPLCGFLKTLPDFIPKVSLLTGVFHEQQVYSCQSQTFAVLLWRGRRGLGVVLIVFLSSVVTAQGPSSSPSASFDTQLREAQLSIQQYADDQVWLYTVTKQEASFDSQLNEALTKIRNN